MHEKDSLHQLFLIVCDLVDYLEADSPPFHPWEKDNNLTS